MNHIKLLQKYPHSDFVTSYRKTTLIKGFREITGHKDVYATNVITRLLNLIETIVPGCTKDDFKVEMLKDYAYQALFYKTILNKTLDEMNKIINADEDKRRSLDCIDSIPGIDTNAASRLLTELYNLERFHLYKSLIAFAGTDPNIDQSGKKDGKHRSITKCRKKRLRTILFMMVRSMVRNRIS